MRFVSLLAALTLGSAGTAPVSAQTGLPGDWRSEQPVHKVLVRSEDAAAASALRATGGVVRSYDYGAFEVLLVDERVSGEAALLAPGVRVRDEWNLVAFDGLWIDAARPLESLAAVPAPLRVESLPGWLPADAGLYVVQLEAPLRDEWEALLDGLGASFRQAVPMNAFVLALDAPRVPALVELARTVPAVQYVGVYQPAHRLTPALRAIALAGGDEVLPVTVQVVDGTGVREALAALRAVAAADHGAERVGPYVNLRLDLAASLLASVAAHPRVFAVEPRGALVRLDERQGQIAAGAVSGGNVTTPGYLAWLAGKGFDASQFGSFAVNVVDDSHDLTGHPDLASSRVAFNQNPSGSGSTQQGHGFLNAHIIGGFNDGTGSAVEDAGGFHYGLGIAPWARVGSTDIFGPGGTSVSSYESSAYASGARLSTNSWGYIDGAQNPIPDYDSNAQQYDVLTRDVQSGTSGNQEYFVLFSAGNSGPGSNTVSTPGTAKNVLSVGASENDRPTGTDGCGIGNSGANDVDDMISFSSRGPVNATGGDGRWKPEISAQGTHVQAGVPQSGFVGGGVCNDYWPSGQTLYGWSSGTSHSTPAVAGGAMLVYQHFLNEGLPAPSPAMMKAVLVGTAEYLTGVNAGDTLPSNTQGMGRMQLERPFGSTPKLLVDQTVVLSSTGASHVVAGAVADPLEPFRVTLVWTDDQGPTTGAPWVNDLDLEVDLGGTLYRGNVFSGGLSVAGGTADFRNNTESVWLPAGATGSFTVTVTAASVSGDGVPGNGDATDQDFALYVYNAAPDGGTSAQFSATPTTGLVPLTVDFTDLSLGDPTSWSWNFGDSGTSTAADPQHTYTATGTYTVTLDVDGPNGPDSITKTDYITVEEPPPPGLSDASFESQAAGTTPTTPWSPFGATHVVSPSGASSDNGMPSHGAQWCEIGAHSTNGATPPSNPGGVTSPPVGGAGISQTFTYPAGQDELRFEAAFLINETPGTQYVDWMSVDVSDGTTTVNLYFEDIDSPTSGTSAKYGYPMTPVETVVADLGALFPSSTPATQFTLTAQVGNGVDDFQPSIGYLDDFVFVGDPLPVAGFSGTPLAGTAPLTVDFTDQSTGGVTAWSWDLGDGATSTAQDPSHEYAFPGSYTVELTATNATGSDVESKADYVQVAFPPAVGTPYGSGTPGSGGVPLVEAFRGAGPSDPLYLRASGVAPSTPVFFAVSTSDAVPGIDLSNGFLLNVGLPINLVKPLATDAAGEAVMKLELGPGITGFSVYVQVVSADGTGGDLFASSAGLAVPL